MDKREEFLKRIQATFKIEAEEGIQKIASNVIEMEKNPPESRMKELLEATFRESHSLKGAARAVNNTVIESVCQALESAFSALKSNQFSPDQQLYDIFHLSIDLLKEILKLSSTEVGPEIKARCDEAVFLLLKAGTAADKMPEVKGQFSEEKPEEKDIFSSKIEADKIISPIVIVEKSEKIKKTTLPRELNLTDGFLFR